MKQTNVCEHVDCLVVFEAGMVCPLCKELGRGTELDLANAQLSEALWDEGLDPKLVFLGKGN